MSNERIQKILASKGYGSRRSCERMISDGFVSKNGQVVHLGDKARIGDVLLCNGRQMTVTADYKLPRVLLYNKKVGEICSRAGEGEQDTVYDNLPKLKAARWVSVGRLDVNTSGLILFTTDGGLADFLMHPRNQFDREYLVRLFGDVSESKIKKLCQGVEIEGERMRFTSVREIKRQTSNLWFKVVLAEGKYREVRRLWQAVDCTVSRLMRIRYGSFKLPKDLKQGGYQELDASQVQPIIDNYSL